jgi:hypothetical protein
MTVEHMEGLKRTTGWSYRSLCGQTGVAYSSLMRWRDRLRRGEPSVRRPGPKKASKLDRPALYRRIEGLRHRQKASLGSGKLYEKFRDRISRQEYQWHVRRIRKEVNRQRLQQMRRIEWLVPGSVWAMDETGRRGLPVKEKISIYQVRDLASRKGMCDHVGARALPSGEVADRLGELFAQHGPPLVLKSDNAGNLTEGEVPKLLSAWGVLALVSPPYWPRYNGSLERSQRELKEAIRWLLGGMAEPADLFMVGMAAELSLDHLNNKPRPCLGGRTADEVFVLGKTVMAEYTVDKREEVRQEVMMMTSNIMARLGRSNRRAQSTARRLAVESWLYVNGFLTVSVGGRVLPVFPNF